MNDPVKHCKLYKEFGCSHVDGMLCDFPKCSMLKEYEESKMRTDRDQPNIQSLTPKTDDFKRIMDALRNKPNGDK